MGNYSKFIAALAGVAGVFSVAASDGDLGSSDLRDIGFAVATAVLVLAFPKNEPAPPEA